MEDKKDLSLSNFRIVFNDQILEINYDTSFKEYNFQTINSVIEEVLKKIGPKPSDKTSKDYILYCSCGRPFNPDKLLFQSKCPHYSESDYNEEKNKNEKYVLYEKEKEETFDKYIKNQDIGTILMKATGAKNLIQITGVIPKEGKKKLNFSENLIIKIKEYLTKKDRGIAIMAHSYDLHFNQQMYDELLEFGIPSNKVKASLRMTHNSKEEALLIATDENINWNNKDFLYYENDEVLSDLEYIDLCCSEISKEFPSLDESEVLEVLKNITDKIKKNKIGNKPEEKNESSEEENESSSECIAEDSDSNMDSASFHFI